MSGSRSRPKNAHFATSAPGSRCPPPELALPDRELVAFLHGLGKGVLYVNGRNLGRYWCVNGHLRYYLPKCWLEETNEVVLFEETDAAPDRIVLDWDEFAVGAVVTAGD